MDKQEIADKIIQDDRESKAKNILQIQKEPEDGRKLTSLSGWKGKVKEYVEDWKKAKLQRLLDSGKSEEVAEKEIKKPLTHPEVAEIMLDLFYFCRLEDDEGNKPVYIYNPDEGTYSTDNEFLKDIINVIEYRHAEKVANDCIYSLKRQAPWKKTEDNPNYIIVGNGLYNRKEKRLEPFTPWKVYTSKIKTNYNPKARKTAVKGWNFDDWLLDLFSGDKDMFTLSLQLFNAVVRGESQGKMFWFIGEGGTGKGTLQELLINLVGRENIASIKITDLDGDNRFTLAQAVGKRAVVGDDVQRNARIKDTSKLFSLVGGDTVSVEKKGKDAYSAFIKTVVIQSTNGMPFLDGDKNAIRRRMIILPFLKVFADGKKKPNRAIKYDYIKRQEVLEYVLKRVIDLDYTDFIKPVISQEHLGEYEKTLDTLQQFSDELFEDIQSTFLPNDFIWWYYVGFVEYHNHPKTYTSQSLHKVFSKYLPEGWEKVKAPVSIPKGADLPKGFNPKADTPDYLNKTFGYYRGKRSGSVRGYRWLLRKLR